MNLKALNPKLFKQELARRAEAAKNAALTAKFSLVEYCFPKQLDFIEDTAKFKSAVCSRRAGKTVACAADLFDTARNLLGNVAYITLNRITAKRIIWRELLKLVEKFETGYLLDNSELTIKLSNGNMIYVSGAKDATEIEKFRGIALRKVYIDEAQSFRAYIAELVQDILVPCLMDYDGSLVLIGTPGPVPAGYFFSAAHNANWANYKWTIQDNPHIRKKSGKEPLDMIKEEAARRGVNLNDPSIRREFFGEWVKDENSLVFKYDAALNGYDNLPADGKWQYIFGIDIGFKDADAIAVIAYDFKKNYAYLVEELVTRKQDISSLADQIKTLQAKYAPIKMVMDAGALGKKIQEEIRVRHQLPVDAATKERKNEFIALFNGDLRRGLFKAKSNSLFAQDAELVVWDWEDPAKPKISDRYHTDIGDAVLYAWREAKHYFEKEVEVLHSKNSVAWMEAQEEKEAEAMELKQQGHLEDWGVEDDDLNEVFDGLSDVWDE